MNYKQMLILENRLNRIERVIRRRMTKNEKVVSGLMPKYFYHGTSLARAENILEDGLRKNSGNRNHPLSYEGVFLTDSIDSARSWAKMLNQDLDFVVLQIDSSFLNPDLLNYDGNAVSSSLIGDFDFEDEDDEDEDEWDEDGYNLQCDERVSFDEDGDAEYKDFVYNGNIPARAISIVWQVESTSSDAAKAKSLIDKGKLDLVYKNWDKYKDLLYRGTSIQAFVSSALNQLTRTNNINSWIKTLDKVPGKIICSVAKGSNEPLLADHLYSMQYISDNSDDLLAYLDERGDIDDNTIERVWQGFTKAKQARRMQQIKGLSDRVLQIGKPYIAKKYWATLGI